MKIKRFNEVNMITPPKLTAADGWVNVKIDEKMFKRMSRYVPALDKITNKPYSMFEKIEKLSSFNIGVEYESLSIQDKISIIIILQYLKEIKNNFNSSSAGFLIEGFLATLIYGELTPERSAADLISKPYDELIPVKFRGSDFDKSRGKSYQIKLYRETKNGIIKLAWDNNRICDYYVICLKNEKNDIDVSILEGRRNGKNSIIEFAQKNKYPNNKIRKYKDGKEKKPLTDIQKTYIKTENDKDYINIKTDKISNNLKMSLKISDIDELIKKHAENIQDNISNMFNKLSEVHYNIDTLITGIDENGKPQVDSVDKIGEKCNRSISELGEEVTKLTKNMSNL